MNFDQWAEKHGSLIVAALLIGAAIFNELAPIFWPHGILAPR